jgi:hypothetical protein
VAKSGKKRIFWGFVCAYGVWYAWVLVFKIGLRDNLLLGVFVYSLKAIVLFIFLIGYAPFGFSVELGFADPCVEKIFSEANGSTVVPEKEFRDAIQTFTDSRRMESMESKPYIKNLITKPEDVFIVIGDIHGYPRSLIKDLLYLKVIGLLSRDFVLDSHVRVVFTGDFSDRGMYGAEVWYLVLSLANKNPDNVFILRGNHETRSIAKRWGFTEELEVKYGMKLEESFTEIFSFCASALYLDVNGEVIQINHGGTPGYRQKIANFLQNNKNQSTIPIDDSTHRALLWNDYAAGKGVEKSKRGNGIYTIGVDRAKSINEKYGIKAVFHGHQHNQFAVSYRDKNGVRRRLQGNTPIPLSTSHVYTFMSYSEEVSGFGFLKIGSSFDSCVLMSVET